MSKFALNFLLLCYLNSLSKSRTNTFASVSMKNLHNLELKKNSCWRWSAYCIIAWPLHHDPHPLCAAHRQQNHFSCISAALKCLKAANHTAQSPHSLNLDRYKHGEKRVSAVLLYHFSCWRMQAASFEGRLPGAEGGGSVGHSALQQGWSVQLNSGNKAVFTHRTFSWFKCFIHFLFSTLFNEVFVCISWYFNLFFCLVLVLSDQEFLKHHRLRCGRTLPAGKWLLHGGSSYGQPLPEGESEGGLEFWGCGSKNKCFSDVHFRLSEYFR